MRSLIIYLCLLALAGIVLGKSLEVGVTRQAEAAWAKCQDDPTYWQCTPENLEYLEATLGK